MKTRILIDTLDNNGNISTKEYKVDYSILGDLFVTVNPKKVKANIKKFNTKKRKAINENDMGLQYSKQANCVILTFGVLINGEHIFGQFLVDKKLDKNKIIDSDHEVINGVKPAILDAIDLANVVTMEDLEKLERFK